VKKYTDNQIQEEYEMNDIVFENPTGNWCYDGPFHVHVIANTNFGHFTMSGIEFFGTIHCWGGDPKFPGRIEQHMGGIQFCVGVGNQPFRYQYKQMIRICRPNGQLIWQNHHLKDVVMQKVKGAPRGNWPMFYYDGEHIIGQVGGSGPWYQLNAGQEVRFNRHGTFRFTKAFKTLAYLDVTLPRKGWNPVKSQYRIRIPTGKCLTVRRNEYCLEWMNSTLLWKGFGYRPGHQPLRDSEVNEMFELLNPGLRMEEQARKALAAANPYEVRSQIRELRFAAARSQDMRAKVEQIKSKMLT